MVVHAAFGGSPTCCCTSRPSPTPPACRRPTVDDWSRINRRVPRLVDVLPNGPVGHPTVRVFLAGGVPEVMLHLRELACCASTRSPCTADPLGDMLDAWDGQRAPPPAARRGCTPRTASTPTT